MLKNHTSPSPTKMSLPQTSGPNSLAHKFRDGGPRACPDAVGLMLGVNSADYKAAGRTPVGKGFHGECCLLLPL